MSDEAQADKKYGFFSPASCRQQLSTSRVHRSKDGPDRTEPPKSGSVYRRPDGTEVLVTEVTSDPLASNSGWADRVCVGEVAGYVRQGTFADIPKEHGIAPAETSLTTFHLVEGFSFEGKSQWPPLSIEGAFGGSAAGLGGMDPALDFVAKKLAGRAAGAAAQAGVGAAPAKKAP